MSLIASVDETLQSLDSSDDLLIWINNSLDSEGTDLAALEQHITHIVASLDIACEETSFRLERVIDDVSRGVPRLTYDLHFMRDSAMTLRSMLGKAQDHSQSSVQRETNEALEQLRILDTMKRHMESAREVLREAESWSSLEMEVTALLGEQSYERAAERLSEASKSMVVFQNTPEYESRRTLMVSLQNQLEASLSSALVGAINTQDVELCRSYFNIFSNIQRESEFRNYYNGSRKAPLNSMWQDMLLDSQSTNSSLGQTFTEFLPKFYSRFLTLLNTERVSMPAVFPNPQQSLSNLIVSVLTTLQPSFSERLSALFDKHGSSVLGELIAALKATQDFAIGTQKVMEKMNAATSSTLLEKSDSSDVQTRDRLHRRRSSRMSMSWRSGTGRLATSTTGASPSVDSDDYNLDWDRELFQPFLDYQVDYGTLERKALREAFEQATTREQRDGNIDKARLMREDAIDLFSIGEESFARCTAFTYGYGAFSLVQTLDGFIETFFDIQAKGAKAQDISFLKSQPFHSFEDLTDLDYTSQDWARLQETLHLLNATRAIYDRLVAFELKLRTNLEHLAAQFAMAETDSTKFTVAPSRGQDILLRQSLLNSAELHTLLNGLRQPIQAMSPSAPNPPLLTAARSGLYAFVKTCQASMQKTILSPLQKQLSTYPTLSIWSASGDPKSRIVASGISDLQVPTFSLSPSEIVQKVSEGLLNLPRLFEVYANDDALAFSLETLPYVNAEILKGISEESHADVSPPRHIRRTSLVTHPPTHRVVLDAETVSSTWLSSLGHSLLSHLMGDILPKIQNLSVAGAAQLSSDLSYLSNILSALNVSSDDLGKWQEYVSMSDAQGLEKMKDSLRQSDTILDSVARMRSWT